VTNIAKSNRLPELAARINQEHAAANDAVKRGLGHAMVAGELLLEAKATVPHGQWADWLKANTTVSDRTAQRYMQLAKQRAELEAKSATVADLTMREACELVAKPTARAVEAWSPPEAGHSLCGHGWDADGTRFVLVTPSDVRDHYFVTHIGFSSAEDDETGLPVDRRIDTPHKPIRWSSLADVVEAIAGVTPADMKWQSYPFTGHRCRNPFDVKPTDPEDRRSEACETLWTALGLGARDNPEGLAGRELGYVLAVRVRASVANFEFVKHRGRPRFVPPPTKDADYLPPEGDVLIGTYNQTSVWIAPSKEHPGHYFVTRVDKPDGPAGDWIVEGPPQPAVGKHVSDVLKVLKFEPSIAEWRHEAMGAWPNNVFMTGSHCAGCVRPAA